MNAVSYTVVTACLAIMALMVLSTAIRLIVLDRGKRLEYVKDFKGQFIVVYLIALPLYIVGALYSGVGAWEAVLTSFSSIAELVILDFQIEPVKALVQADAFYSFALNCCFVLVACNAVLFASSIFAQKLSLQAKKLFTRLFSKKILVVVGFNQDNQKILSSVTDGTATFIICYDGKAVMDYAYINRHAYAVLRDDEKAGDLLTALFGKMKKRKVNVVVNTGDDARNLVIVKSITESVLSVNFSTDEISRERGLNAFAFGEPENAEVFAHFVKKSKGRVHYVNKHTLIAMEFTTRYPITEFMTGEHIDYETATVKPQVSPTVVMVGFSETARALFLTMVENNQLVCLEKGKLKQKKVKYRVFDDTASENDKNLNHTYFRYEREFSEGTRAGYLPLPPTPADAQFIPVDINDKTFYEKLRASLAVKKDEIGYGYIVIDYGEDMENLDIAEKLYERLVEWEKKDEFKIFVKVSDGSLCSTVAKEYGSNAGFICFGNEDAIVYNERSILSERNERMAKDRHLCYALESLESKRKTTAVKPMDGKKSKNEIKELEKAREEERNAVLAKATNKWFVEWEQVQRESNAYAVMSIRLKLHLLGYDYAPKAVEELDEKWTDTVADEFLSDYQSGDEIKYESEDCFTEIGDKKTVDYGKCDFKTGTVRYNLAVLEHQRWNAYEIINGYIPASIKEMLTLDKQTMIKSRKHANITTFDGLIEFRKITAENQTEKLRKNGNETAVVHEWETDVIKYDYQLLDDCAWLLRRNGFKFIKRK